MAFNGDDNRSLGLKLKFFPCQDALEVRMSSTTPGDEKKPILSLALIFIHILTYLEEELACRHWERLLRATSTWAIFTVLQYKKVLIKTSQRCVPLVTQGPQIFTIDPYHTKFQLSMPFFHFSHYITRDS